MVDIRFITDDEAPAFARAVSLGFGNDLTDRPDFLEGMVSFFPRATSMAAFDGDRIVATFGSHDLELTVPGDVTVPMAGTTVVTVQPTHRRRGILTRMMRRHLGQAIERHQPLAGLWASEETIYRRFGYGVAAEGDEIEISCDRVTATAPPANATVRFLEEAEARVVLPAVFDRVRPTVAGLFARSSQWWDHRHFRDPEWGRNGASRRRFVVAARDGDDVGYAMYRQREKWDDHGSVGKVEVVELVAVDDDARRALWSLLSTVDLYPHLEWWNAPVDEPVRLEVDRFRRVSARRHDSLWVRLLDLPRALAARRYEHPGSVTLGVVDPYLGRGGTVRLDVDDDGGAACEPTTAAPDVTLDVADLGSLYLGGGSALALARAGRLTGDQGAVDLVDDLFRTRRAPYCIEIF
ncbi:MAG: GNAT family N-acetyltransferase [Acidimicrobiales bacterium]